MIYLNHGATFILDDLVFQYIIQDQEKAVVPLIVHRCNCVDLCFKHKSNSCNLIDSFAKGKGLLFQGKPLQN